MRRLGRALTTADVMSSGLIISTVQMILLKYNSIHVVIISIHKCAHDMCVCAQVLNSTPTPVYQGIAHKNTAQMPYDHDISAYKYSQYLHLIFAAQCHSCTIVYTHRPYNTNESVALSTDTCPRLAYQ
jgi:hypothetical protein